MFFSGNGNGFFIHLGIRSAFRRIEFICDRMSYITLRYGCDIVILNMHAPVEDKSNDLKNSFFEEVDCVFDQFLKYHVKILLGDLSTSVGNKGIFKTTVGNESLHDISNDTGIRVVNFATSENQIVMSTVFLHHNIYKYTWCSCDEKTHNQVDHVLMRKRRHSSKFDL
jgi:hypothetical protein